MPAPFDSHSRNFGELLGQYEKRQVVVPQFQRGYSWERTHVAAFWSDLSDFKSRLPSQSASVKYFLGPIVILEEDSTILLLDGQQRLATATILFAALRGAARALATQAGTDLARDIHRDLVENEPGRFSLRLSETDEVYFLTTIQKDPTTHQTPRLRSHSLIKSARDFLAQAVARSIEGLSHDEAVTQLKGLRDVVATSVTMVAISVSSEEDAFRIFETLNDRGLRLSVPDLLLNHLMRTTTSSTDRSRIRERWNFMLEKMGRRDIDRFLRHMWLSKYGDVKARGLFAEIKEFLHLNKIDSLQFAEACAEECESYVALLDLNEGTLGDAVKDVAALLRYLDIQSSLPLLLAGLRSLSKGHFGKLTKSALSLAVRHSVVANLNPSDLETGFYTAARKLRTERGAGQTSSKSLREARIVLKAINPPDAELKPRADALLLTRGEAVYILTTMANTLQSKTKEVSVDDANLEHIFPQNPDASWGDTSALDPLTWHIGNLTILGTKLNRKAANADFPTKATKYYFKSEIRMTKEIPQKHTVWTPSDILDRARSLFPLLLQTWRGL